MLGWIDLNGNLIKDESCKSHSQLNNKYHLAKDYRKVVSKLHYIRINDGSNLLLECLAQLPNTEITDAQYLTLENWLYDLTKYRNQVEIEIDVKTGDTVFWTDKSKNKCITFWKIYPFDEYLPEDIIEEIKSYYNQQKFKQKED